MIRRSIENPHAVAVATLFVVLAGVVTVLALPLQLRPTVEPPEIEITTLYSGAAPAEVEDQITRRVEQQARGVNGLREMVSTSSASRSSITLRFEDGVDRNAAMVDVLNKMAGVQGMPPEADPPEVNAITSDQQSPVMWLGVRAPDGVPDTPVDVLRATVDDVIAPALRRVDGVAGLIVSGGESREIHVVTNFDALAQRGMSVGELLGALSRENHNQRGGPLWSGKREYNVRTLARAETLDDLRGIVLRRDESGSTLLSDVAKVERGASLDHSIMRQDGIPAVAIGLQRRTGANVPTTVAGVRAAIAELHAAFAQSGVPVYMRELYSETTYIDAAVAEAGWNIAEGALLAAIVLLVVLRSWRAVMLVGMAQPLAVLGVFPVLWLLDRSLNIITLAGLAFAVGITIDNAIVVMENVFRHREEGADPLTAALNGTREVAGAMLAATVTNICVFAPVVFLDGEAGQIFRDLAIAISAASAFSLVAVLTVVPAAAARWMGAAAGPVSGDPGSVSVDGQPSADVPVGPSVAPGPGRLARMYGRVVDAVTAPTHGWRFVVILVAVLASAAGFFFVPAASYLPEGNRNLILTFARPLPGTSADAAAELLEPIERALVADPRVWRTFVVFNSRFSAVGMVLQDAASDEAHFGAFLAELRGRVTTIPGFRFLFPRRASIFNNPGRQFDLTFTGPDLDTLATLAASAQARLRTIAGVGNVRSDYETGTPEIRVVPDDRRLAESHLRSADLGNAVEAAVGGKRVGTFLDEGRELDLVVLGSDAIRHDVAALSAVPVAPGVRVDAVARVGEGLGPVSIAHFDQERAITLQVSLLETAALGQIIDVVNHAVLADLRSGMKPGYSTFTGGSADRLAEALSGLRLSFGWAILIVYLLLVALYRSWGQPIVILTAVPLAVCGALLSLAAVNVVTRVDFDTIAMLGLILLCGVVVNTSILIVSQAQEFVAQGFFPRVALRESAITRLRPILMSLFTSVVGMLPLAAGSGSGTELYRGLGVIMVGGLVLSTVFVPLVVPAMMALSPAWRRDAR